jgi:aminopeptidase N
MVKADRVRMKVYSTATMQKLALILAAIALAASACSKPASKVPPASAAPSAAHGVPGAALRLPTTVQPMNYRIDLTPDADKLTFAGSETIQLQVNQEVPAITLNALELQVSRATLDGKAAKKISLDADHQTASFDFGQPVGPGQHTLAIDYAGKIDDFSAGLFHLDYNTSAGPRRLLVTQFENADARRLAPMWDDPGVKANFQLSVVAPAGQMAVSNTPAAEVQPLAGGLQRTTFQPTPKMSSYLLFLAVGDLERINRNVDGVDVGVIVRRGEAVKAQFALDEASAILRYYNDYFGIKFPLPKLDLIAAPGSGGFGAMENWGAIMYFERELLIDPKYSTEQDRQDVALTIAHEMAHQWFGDLVTMSWWNDLWLNESFAEWMEGKAVDHLHPEWRILLSESQGREAAMKLDSASATHPIIRPVETTQQMNEIGDAITYDKGMAVLRMLEAYVGPDAWRRGVQAYLKAHAYGNATHDDLWRAIEAAAGKPISGMAEDFTLQDGVPLIGVQVMPGQKGSGLLLTEERFAADAGSKAPRHWRTPVGAKPLKGAEVQTVVHGGPLVTSLTSPDPGPLVVNPGQVGYYRTLYTPPAFDPLAQRFGRLDAFDQQNMLQDSWALAQAGYAPPSDLMVLFSRLPPDAYPLVWSNAADMISQIYYLHAPSDRAAIAAFGRRILEPVLGRIGWVTRSGEPAAAAVAREQLILTLGDLGDPGVLTVASLRFQQFLANPRSLPADIRKPVLYVVGERGGPQAFEALQRLALASTDPLEQRLYLTALARAEDPALAQRALDFALSPQVQHSAGMTMIRTVSARHPDLVWRFATAHKAEIDARSDPGEKLFFIPKLLNDAADASLADALHAYAERYFPAGGRAEANQVEARVRQRADVRTNQLPKLDAWLKGRGGTSPTG